MFKTIMIGTIIIACASIAAAQSDYKKFEFFGGYSHNRVDTGLGDDELYLAVPGSAIEQVLGELNTIIDANIELEKFHNARAEALRA